MRSSTPGALVAGPERFPALALPQGEGETRIPAFLSGALRPESVRSRGFGLTQQTALEEEVATLIAEAVNLERPIAEIDPDIPLFGDGLGLDSIDVLEIALAVSKKYGFQLRSDDPANRRIFATLRSLSAHIAQHRAR